MLSVEDISRYESYDSVSISRHPGARTANIYKRLIKNIMSFLPEGYRAPEGNYAKFRPGENTFRVLGSAVVGYEFWDTNNKPVRSREQPQGIPHNIRVDEGGKISIRHFWMFPIWNYDANKIQLLEVTQKGIQESIKALVANPKWGDPKEYDITVTKDGTGFDTNYNVMPNPKTVLDPAILERFKTLNLSLEAVFDGKDPFMTEAEAPSAVTDISVDNIDVG